MVVDHALRRLRVDRVERPAERVLALYLVDPDGTELPPWRPGAHIDVVLRSGLVRQYSLCSDPADRHRYRVAVLHEPNGRGGSREIHESQLLGDEIGVRGPRNHFELVPAANYLFIAGGIGVTPLLAQAREAAHQGAKYEFAYGGRSRASMAFADELAELAGGAPAFYPQDEVGLLPLDNLLTASPTGPVYCCGPEPMIVAVHAACARHRRLPDLHFERFSAAGSCEPAPSGQRAGFEVEAGSTGTVIQVSPETSILDALRAQGYDLASSCEEGFCGACELGVIAGLPEHHDTILSPEEQEKNETMMICVGRSKTPRLVLDI
jgi:ferredoxin-NADP reductase